MRDDGEVTIHSEHPFQPPEGDHDPVRRLRGRLPSPVTVWAGGETAERAGLTVSSMLVGGGEPAHALALVDEDSELWELLQRTRTAAVSVLAWRHRALADAFAGVAPAPGGAFRMAEWRDSEWGPILADAVAWAGVRLGPEQPRHAGWSLLVDAVIEHVEIAPDEDDAAMTHLRGRYRSL